MGVKIMILKTTTTTFKESQSFLGSSFVIPKLYFTILTSGFPVSSLCLLVEVTLESDVGFGNGYGGNGYGGNGNDDDDS